MLRAFAAIAVCGILLWGAVASVSASPPPRENGIPGTPLCFGQTMAALAQLGTQGDYNAPGVGNLARLLDETYDDGFDYDAQYIKGVAEQYGNS